jgi:hypothetical protein
MYGYPPGPPPGYFQPAFQPRVAGYRMQPRIGLIIAGSVMLGSMWLISAVSGGVAEASCDPTYGGGGSSYGCSTSYWPMYIPVLGPFIQMGFLPNDGTQGLALVGLAFDGLVQVSGLVMIIVGATLRQRVPVYAQKWNISPTFTSGGSGFAFTTRF